MKNPLPLGIQSYCFRHFKSHDQVIEKLKACGVTGVELCAVHVDFKKPELFSGVIDNYSRSGIQILSIGVNTIDGKEEESHLFDFIKQAEARFMSVHFSPQTSPQSWHHAEKLAELHDVKIAIHNHGGKHWLGSRQMLRHILSQTNDRIGICLDTAWALDSGENPLQFVEEMGNRIYGVHLKDFTFDRARKPTDVVIGEGNLQLPALLSALEKVHFSGYAVIEYEGDIENPVPALKRCVEAWKEASQK